MNRPTNHTRNKGGVFPVSEPRVLTRPPHGWASTRRERTDAYLSSFWPILMMCVISCVLGISVFGATITTLNQLLTFG